MTNNQPKIWLCIECKQYVDYVHTHDIYDDVCVKCSGMSDKGKITNIRVNLRFNVKH